MSLTRRDFVALSLTSAPSLLAAESPSWTFPETQMSPEHTNSDHMAEINVIGGTPGGIACAVRAARQGVSVMLVNRTQHLGGMVSGGIGVADTQYDGVRSPLLHEFQEGILNYYRSTYGANSPQYKSALPGPRYLAGKRLTFEPHVGEMILDNMVAAEKNITVLKGYYPYAVERAERMIMAVMLASEHYPGTVRVRGDVFVDATYEGDLAAAAGVPYRIGREDRNEFNEPHAGRYFASEHVSRGGLGEHPTEAVTGKLNLRPFQAVTQEMFVGSTGEGDAKIQAYNYRLCLTRDPNNRRHIEMPANYQRREFLDRYGNTFPGIGGNDIPNQKANWWQNPEGEQDAYPGGNWSVRHKIEARYREFALGLLYFLQNDQAVPQEQRKQAAEWGLAKDEFTDNDNFPYEIYARETRRIEGRYILKEQDASLARGYERTPIQSDSIAIAEWFMDSHEVSRERQLGSDAEGKLILSELTRPSQIPYRTLLPRAIDNLLVPICLSCTHVAWGTIRLEPTWMHIGESAGFAAALAIQRVVPPAMISVPELQRRLVENGVMISFFNDFDMSNKAPWVPAIEYLATKGLLDSYEARASDLLSFDVAREWARSAARLASGNLVPDEAARAVAKLSDGGRPISGLSLKRLLVNAFEYWNIDGGDGMTYLRNTFEASDRHLTRAEGAQLIYELLSSFDHVAKSKE